MIQEGRATQLACLEGKTRGGFPEKEVSSMINERGEEVRVPSWENLQNYLPLKNASHSHPKSAAQNLLKASRVELGVKMGEQDGALVPIHLFEQSCTWV